MIGNWVYSKITEELKFKTCKLLQAIGQSAKGLGQAVYICKECKEGVIFWSQEASSLA